MSTNDEEETQVPEDAVADLAAAKTDAETNSAEVVEVKDPAETVEPETPPESDHDKDWYKKAYEESTKEALRLKALADEPKAPPATPSAPSEPVLTPEQLYIRQKQDEEIAEAFTTIQEDYPQVKDDAEYKRFSQMAQAVGKNITDAEKRLPPPKEVYAKTVVLLGWTADANQERLGAALKNGAAAPRIASGSPAPKSNPKVTDAMIIANRKMYPGKSDAEIREELEPHIQ